MEKLMSAAGIAWTNDYADEFERLRDRLSPKAKAALLKHLEPMETDAAKGYARNWKRVAGMLGHLASHAVEVNWPGIRFFIADGKYRKQVFALEETKEGDIRVFLPDVTAAAVTRKLLAVKAGGAESTFKGRTGGNLELQGVCADDKDISPSCKAMLGWGRKAVRSDLGPLAGEADVRLMEELCHLAAEAWAEATAEKV